MQTKAEHLLNPLCYYLSDEAKKRLRWLYLLYYECDGEVSAAANKIGISREWLSRLKNKFEKNNRNPRSLEPKSKAPHNRDERERIPNETENKIIEIRDKYGWGKGPTAVVLLRDYGLKVSPSTVNRYFHKHLRICPKISARNKKAWEEKKLREAIKEGNINFEAKYRPPKKIKDYRPGALVEKDMKLVPTINKKPLKSDGKYHIKNYFNYQHTLIDSFTRIRALEMTEEPSSQEASESYQRMEQKMPFSIACVNTDNGSENEKDFKEQLAKNETFHFFSNISSPTHNPRVERSHLTDEKEFYAKGNCFKSFTEQKEALRKWEHVYNFVRPHQALGNLTPMEFYQLWQNNPQKAYAITDQYQAYLEKQKRRLNNSRRIKKKEQIEALMRFIDAKLRTRNAPPDYQAKRQKINLRPYKLKLIKCELCSWT